MLDTAVRVLSSSAETYSSGVNEKFSAGMGASNTGRVLVNVGRLIVGGVGRLIAMSDGGRNNFV